MYQANRMPDYEPNQGYSSHPHQSDGGCSSCKYKNNKPQMYQGGGRQMPPNGYQTPQMYQGGGRQMPPNGYQTPQMYQGGGRQMPSNGYQTPQMYQGGGRQMPQSRQYNNAPNYPNSDRQKQNYSGCTSCQNSGNRGPNYYKNRGSYQTPTHQNQNYQNYQNPGYQNSNHQNPNHQNSGY
jgi:hypothetical protein